jgi:hypothetical protein
LLLDSEQRLKITLAVASERSAVRDAAQRMAELRCRQFDLESLTTFRDGWFDELRG